MVRSLFQATAVSRKAAPLNGKSNGKKSEEIFGPLDVVAEKPEITDQRIADVSNPFLNMDSRPAESFHVCKLFVH